MADKYEPKYLNKDSKNKKSNGKVKSQQDIEKIEAAKAVLEKYRPMLEEISQASLDILAGTVMRPIHQKLEQMQTVADAQKEMRTSIENTIKSEKKKIEEFETRVDRDVKSEDLDNIVIARNLVTLGRTNFAKAHAISAQMPHTLAATFYALKGDEGKRDELLDKAKINVDDILSEAESKNSRHMQETKRRVDTFNKVDKETTHYKTREIKAGAIDSMTQEFLERNSKRAIRRNVSLPLATIGNNRIFVGNMGAQLIENAGNFIGRKAAILGLHDVAKWVSEKTVDSSDTIMKNVGMKNKATYNQLDRRTAGYDRAESVSKKTRKNLDRLQAKSEKNADRWEKEQVSTGVLTREGMKAVKFSNRLKTTSTKWVAKGDITLSELYAKTASVIGFDQHGKQVIQNAEERNINRMNAAESFNKKTRQAADRVFCFKDRKKEEIKNVGRDVAEFVDSVGSEIETQRAQHQAKRRFKAAERKVNRLELVRRNAQNVIDLISPSLSNAEMERVAAQTELNMNPEKSNSKKEKQNRENDEGRE